MLSTKDKMNECSCTRNVAYFSWSILSVGIVSIMVSPTAVMCHLILLHALATIQNPYLSNTCHLSSFTRQYKSLCFTCVCPST